MVEFCYDGFYTHDDGCREEEVTLTMSHEVYTAIRDAILAEEKPYYNGISSFGESCKEHPVTGYTVPTAHCTSCVMEGGKHCFEIKEFIYDVWER